VVPSRSGKTPHQIGGRPAGNACPGEVAIGAPDIGLDAARERQHMGIPDRPIPARGGDFQRYLAFSQHGRQRSHEYDRHLREQFVDDREQLQSSQTEFNASARRDPS
jgi:hypothetical protein